MPRKIFKTYVPDDLSNKDKKKQIKSILEGKDRPKVDYPSIRSKWSKAFEKKYGKKITNRTFIDKHFITKTGIQKILDKGMGAYYSQGSRPNQTKESWSYARLASVILYGPAFRIDKDIALKYGRKSWLDKHTIL